MIIKGFSKLDGLTPNETQLDAEAFTVFMRKRTGKTLPRWESGTIKWIQAQARLGFIRQDLSNPDNYPRLLDKFNMRSEAHSAPSSSFAQGCRRKGGVGYPGKRYTGTQRYPG